MQRVNRTLIKRFITLPNPDTGQPEDYPMDMCSVQISMTNDVSTIVLTRGNRYVYSIASISPGWPNALHTVGKYLQDVSTD